MDELELLKQKNAELEDKIKVLEAQLAEMKPEEGAVSAETEPAEMAEPAVTEPDKEKEALMCSNYDAQVKLAFAEKRITPAEKELCEKEIATKNFSFIDASLKLFSTRKNGHADLFNRVTPENTQPKEVSIEDKVNDVFTKFHSKENR